MVQHPVMVAKYEKRMQGCTYLVIPGELCVLGLEGRVITTYHPAWINNLYPCKMNVINHSHE